MAPCFVPACQAPSAVFLATRSDGILNNASRCCRLVDVRIEVGMLHVVRDEVGGRELEEAYEAGMRCARESPLTTPQKRCYFWRAFL